MKLFSLKTLPFIGILLVSFSTLVISIWGIVSHEDLVVLVAVIYSVLLMVVLLLLFRMLRKTSAKAQTVAEFEKTLKGKLHHFKCPSCGGIFAVKKSKLNNKRAFMLTCPDCGAVGQISTRPKVIVEDIPEKKSVNKNFICSSCGEWISVWAEGAELAADLHVYSCPYCGVKQDLRRT